jgi:hypothetical protein
MNNIMFDELVAREYRQDRMAEAEKYRLVVRPEHKSIQYRFGQKIAAIGKRLETYGAQLQHRFDNVEKKAIAIIE